MASINKVIIVGNLGNDPEVRTFDNGGKIATVSIATSERWTDKNTGELREHTEWHRVVFNNRLADVVAQYLKKGSQIYVEGSLRTRKWQDQNGQDRYSTEIRADVMQMLGSRNSGGGYGGQNQGGQNYNNYNQGGYNQNSYADNGSYGQNQYNGQSQYNQGMNAGHSASNGFDSVPAYQNQGGYNPPQNNAAPANAPQNGFGTPSVKGTTPSQNVTDDDMPF